MDAIRMAGKGRRERKDKQPGVGMHKITLNTAYVCLHSSIVLPRTSEGLKINDR